MRNRHLIAVFFSGSLAGAQTVGITGTVLTVSGSPVAGATCQFKSISNKAVTGADGKYDFSGATAVRRSEGYSISMQFQGRNLSLNLERGERVSLDLFSLAGKLLGNIADGNLPAGTHSLAFAAPEASHKLCLLRAKL